MNFKYIHGFFLLFAILLFVQCEKDHSLQPTSDRIHINDRPVFQHHVLPIDIEEDGREDDLGYFTLTHIFNFGGFAPMPDVVCETETSVEAVVYDETNNNISITVDAIFEEGTDEMPAFSETIELILNSVSEGSHSITPNTNTCYITSDNQYCFENEGLFTVGNVSILEVTDTYVIGAYSIGSAMGGCVIDESMLFGLIEGDFQIFF
ncbi:MAG: hypothetical protein ACPG5B_05785 [Chitinophagales bacterium]